MKDLNSIIKEVVKTEYSKASYEQVKEMLKEGRLGMEEYLGL